MRAQDTLAAAHIAALIQLSAPAKFAVDPVRAGYNM